ncbi:MAG: hypothetical protein LBN97_02395 [Oscillospiraceae bacterium]|jgi:hypothetical protein|nr:hypothetical protein [Oscillospiraceae bacterium]
MNNELNPNDFDLDTELALLDERIEIAGAAADAAHTQYRAIKAEKLTGAVKPPHTVAMLAFSVILVLAAQWSKVNTFLIAAAVLFAGGVISFVRAAKRAGAHDKLIREETIRRKFENDRTRDKYAKLVQSRSDLEREAKRIAYQKRLRAALDAKTL